MTELPLLIARAGGRVVALQWDPLAGCFSVLSADGTTSATSFHPLNCDALAALESRIGELHAAVARDVPAIEINTDDLPDGAFCFVSRGPRYAAAVARKHAVTAMERVA